jgi:hypothetical protein
VIYTRWKITLKIRNKFPEYNEEKNNFLLADGWVVLKEPKNILLTIVYSIPLMFFLSLISIGIINFFSPTPLQDFGVQLNGFIWIINFPDILVAIIIIYAIIYAHEIIHLIFIPDFLHSKTTYLGLSWFGGYAYTEEVITKVRYIVIGTMPFLLISVLFVVILGVTGHLTPLMKIVGIMNALGSSVDFFTILLVLLQVPDKSKIVMNGPLSYHKVS